MSLLASVRPICLSPGENTVASLCVFPFLLYRDASSTSNPALVFAYFSQLPPSHPAAPPEHLKEPLAYMRKAQVSLSHLIFVTSHVFLFYLLESF